jgi:hypothetical protein
VRHSPIHATGWIFWSSELNLDIICRGEIIPCDKHPPNRGIPGTWFNPLQDAWMDKQVSSSPEPDWSPHS